MVETLRGLAEGSIWRQVQDHSLATLAPILKREDGWIDFSRGAKQVYDRWRGFQPWPGAHTMLRGKKLIVHRMCLVERHPGAEEGMLVVHGDSMCVGCGGETVVRLDEVQMEGKRRMSAPEFLHGHQIKSGERLGHEK
jgi:methionyl-tRNA formyltransferase